MRVGYADHAGVADRRGYAPATQARCDGRGGTSHQTQSSKRVRAKLMPLPSYRKRIFRSAVKVKLSGAQARPDRDRIPAFSKAGIRFIPPPRHRGYAAKPPTATAADASRLCRPRRRRRPSGLRARYAGALRRGGRDFTPNAVFQEGKGKTDALTLLSQAYFSECCQGQALRRASATLTEIEYPLLVKRVFSHPPPRHRGYAAKPPTATAADASRLCRPRRRRRPSGLRARYAGALRRGGEGLHTKRSLPRG